MNIDATKPVDKQFVKFKLPAMMIAAMMIAVVACSIASSSIYASNPETMDDLGFNAVINENAFSSGLILQGRNIFALGKDQPSQIETNIELDAIGSATNLSINPINDDLDSLTSSYQSQGLKIRRLSTSLRNDVGTFTVGSDWANFQDFLAIDNSILTLKGNDNRSVASQIKWLSPNGFSIALEDSKTTNIFSPVPLSEDQFGSSPSLILSWQGGPGGVAGEYRVTALGTQLDGKSSGQSFDGRDVIGWGLNLEGGWQIGDLFTALSVTYGNGINSYILQRNGDQLLVKPNDVDDFGGALSIRPSLHYSLNNNSSFHVALSHYDSEDTTSLSGIDTLDTIHMGYSWSPWQSTKFGLELVGQNSQGPDGDSDETRFRFGAQKQF